MIEPQPKEKYASVNGLQFHFRDWEGHGRAMLLLHGLASHAGIWNLVAPILARHARVVALDLRGHGGSDKPDGGYDFDTVTQDVMRFCRVLGLRKPLIAGHSWGGNMALHCAANYPSEVSGLVMVDGGCIEPSSLPGWTWERAREELAPPMFGNVTLRQVTDRIKGGSLAPYMNPAVERILAANFYVTPEGFARPNLRRENHMKIVRALWEHKPSLLFPQVRCPTLILPARKDSPDPTRANRQECLVRRAERLLPNGQVIWLEDSVHDVPLQRPRRVAQLLLDFAFSASNPHMKTCASP